MRHLIRHPPHRLAAALLPALAVAACAPAAPDRPTWYADIQPLLRGNCVRCHDGEPLGGAPVGMRFDLYDDVAVYDPMFETQTTWSGARSYANPSEDASDPPLVQFAVRYTGTQPMPPNPYRKLSDRQKQIIENWVMDPRKGTRPASNRPPEVTLRGFTVGAGGVTIDYEAHDPDRDGLWGTIKFGPGDKDVAAIIPQNGIGSVVWDTGKIPVGSYSLTAVVRDDDVDSTPVSIGPVTIK